MLEWPSSSSAITTFLHEMYLAIYVHKEYPKKK